MKKQHLRIQEGHFLKSALNLDLTLSDYGKCPALLESSGIIDLGAFCVELWPKQVSYRISVPMSYISCSRLIISMFHKSQKTRGPGGLRPQGHRKSRADLKNNNFAPKNKWVTIWGGGSRGGPGTFSRSARNISCRWYFKKCRK